MDKIKLIGKLILLIVFFGLLFFVVEYADTIRSLVLNQSIYKQTVKDVAGVSTDFEDEVKEDVGGIAEQAKNRVLQITISDILNSFSRFNKVKNDISAAKDSITNELKIITENEKIDRRKTK